MKTKTTPVSWREALGVLPEPEHAAHNKGLSLFYIVLVVGIILIIWRSVA